MQMYIYIFSSLYIRGAPGYMKILKGTSGIKG